MINEENEKMAIFPVCLECLTTDLCFTSDDYLYHQKCFQKLILEIPISRQDFLYCFPVNKLIYGQIYFGKNLTIFLE